MPRSVTIKLSEAQAVRFAESLRLARVPIGVTDAVAAQVADYLMDRLGELADLLDRGLEESEPEGPPMDVWQRPRGASASDTVPSSDPSL